MNHFSVDMDAYRTALASRECPYHRPVEVYQALGEIAEPGAQELVAEYKPETYGALSLVIENMVESVLAEPATHPIVTESRKATVRNGYSTQAESDVPLVALMFAWQDRMKEFAKTTAGAMDSNERYALDSLLHIRGAAGNNDNVEEALAGGGGTASQTCGLLARSMNEQLKSMGYDKDARLRVLRRSYQPMLDCTTLYFEQLDSFSDANLGSDKAFGGLLPTLDLTKARTDLFNLSEETGRMTFTTPPEHMPGRGTHLAGDAELKAEEPRIGCPIRLTPNLAKRLWVAFIDSMVANDIV